MGRKFRLGALVFCLAALLARCGGAAEVVRVAGGGERDADGVPATGARLNEPFATAFDAAGNLYIAEMVGGRILRVDGAGVITRVAGRETQADVGDGGPAAEALFNGMHHVIDAGDDALLIADTWNHRVRRLDLKRETIAPFAGTGAKGFSGDEGVASAAEFGDVYCLALTADGKALYIADLDNRRIRAIAMATGIVSTVAGNGERGVPRDGALAMESPLVDPRAVTVDAEGNIYILERGGHALRVVDAEGRIRTVAGTGKPGATGDGGPAIEATLNGPKHLCVDGDGNVIIADTENHAIRRYLPKDGRIERVAGTGAQGAAGAAGEGGDPLAVQLNRPHGVAIGPDGFLYIADSSNHRILKIVP